MDYFSTNHQTVWYGLLANTKYVFSADCHKKTSSASLKWTISTNYELARWLCHCATFLLLGLKQWAVFLTYIRWCVALNTVRKLSEGQIRSCFHMNWSLALFYSVFHITLEGNTANTLMYTHKKRLALQLSDLMNDIFILYYQGARCSSVVRAFAHGAIGRRIDPSWGGPIELFLIPASDPRLLSCLWDNGYKRTLAGNRKEYPMWQ